MRQPIKLFLLSIVFLLSISGYAQDQCKAVGWATQNGGVTGGGTAAPTVVTTYAALKTALTTASVKVVHVSGTITFPANGRITIQDTDGKSIIGLAGARLISVDKTSSGSGILYVKRTTNLIIRNLIFEGPGAYDVDGNDNLTYDDVQNSWVDHCDFQDGMDGNFDMKNMTDYISVTWCKFSYKKPPIAGGSGGSNDHRFTDLIGSSDGATQDAGKLRITFQYCWWAEGCVERMPRVRFGKLHIANCFYNSSVSNSCIRAGYKADLLIESNVFVGVNKPIDLYNNDFTAVTARNNIFTNTSGGTTGSGTAFTPPYTLTIAAASTVQSLITNTACGTGATLDSPTQCGCGTVVNQNPVATITAPVSGSSACIGIALTITATATDDVLVSKVDFYNGTTLLGSDNTAPYSISYTPSTAATLTLQATATDNAGATGTAATVTVSVSALPTATIASSTTNLCPSGSILLTASTGTSYKWFNGTTQVGTASTYTAATAGSYTVEVTNAGGCKAISTARVITGTPQTTPTITSPATSFCDGSSVVLTASSGASYKWFNGSTQVGTAATYSANTAGAYTVEVTNASGCKATSAVTQISVSALPTATITTPSTSFCAGSSVVLTATNGASYKWFNGSTQVGTAATYTAATAGAYTVEITNANNCKATSAVTQITVHAAPATPTITSPATSFCTGGSVVLTASPATSYKWFNGTAQVGTAATFTAATAGAYTVEVTNATNCKATSAVTQIGINAAPATPTITSPATSFCPGGSVLLTASSASSYKWFNGTTQVGTAATYTANTAGAYTVEVTNASGCKATSAVTQIGTSSTTVPAISSPSTSICDGSSLVLTASAGESYKWFNGSTQVGTASTYSANTAGAYTVEVTYSGGCKATSAVTQIGISAIPVATISTPSTSICTGGSAVLTASSGASYKWFNGTTQVGTASTYTAATVGNYTVEVTNANTCKATSASTQITVTTLPAPTITSSETSICAGGSVILSSSTAASYKWFNGTTQVGTSSAYTANTAGSYIVEITTANGCKSTSAVTQITNTPTVTWYADTDNDGSGDVLNTLNACTQPNGYVVVAGDACPTDVNKVNPGNCGCNQAETPSCIATATIDRSNAGIKVVPQPFDSNTSITIENLGTIQSITIISSSGAVVEMKTNIQTESILVGDSLASGLYTVIIQSEKGMYTTKIVKK